MLIHSGNRGARGVGGLPLVPRWVGGPCEFRRQMLLRSIIIPLIFQTSKIKLIDVAMVPEGNGQLQYAWSQ